MRSNIRAVAFLVAGAVVTASCVQQDPPGLTLSKLEAKLVFGIDETPEAGLTPTEASQQIPVLDIPDLFLGNDRPDIKPYLPPVDPNVDPCPAAKNAAAVEFGATDNVNTDRQKNRPVEGVYRWRIMAAKGEGAKDLPYGRLTPGGFELRAIRNVREVPKAQWSANPAAPTNREVFTFEEVRNLSFRVTESTSAGRTERLVERFLISTYLVDTAAVRARPSQGDVATQIPAVGNPERGIVLKKSVTIDGAGQPVPGIDPFEPSNGLTLMGLPFVTGETFTASATDASHGTTVTNQTTVGSRDRLNMCGELMEGFPAVSAQTISSNNPSSPAQAYEVRIWLAPQHGGVPIYESTYSETSGLRIVLHRASLHPIGPVPADGLPR